MALTAKFLPVLERLHLTLATLHQAIQLQLPQLDHPLEQLLQGGLVRLVESQ